MSVHPGLSVNHTVSPFLFQSNSDTPTILVIGNEDDGFDFPTAHLRSLGYRITLEASLHSFDKSSPDELALLVLMKKPPASELESFINDRMRQFPCLQLAVISNDKPIADFSSPKPSYSLRFRQIASTDISNLDAWAELVDECVAAWRMARESRNWQEAFGSPIYLRESVITESHHLRNRGQSIHEIAHSSATVLIEGESGTGKSTIARWIHQLSQKSHQPFVPINCNDFPRDQFGDYLFGVENRSDPNSLSRRPGLIELASHGTLFLHHIDAMPLRDQEELLTCIRDKTSTRRNGEAKRAINVRLIASTAVSIESLVERGAFNELLFQLVIGSRIELNPLRERQGELMLQVERALARACSARRLPTKAIPKLVEAHLKQHPWLGNYRELDSFAEFIALRNPDSIIRPQIAMEFLASPKSITGDAIGGIIPLLKNNREVIDSLVVGENRLRISSSQNEGSSNESSSPYPSRLTTNQLSIRYPMLAGYKLDDIEREAIIQTLRSCQGNKAKTARELGISEKSIYNKMRRLGITEA